MTRSPWHHLLAAYSAADLPLCRRFEMSPEALIAISGADRLGDLTPANTLEMPQLAAVSAATLTAEALSRGDELAAELAAALRTALQRRQWLWLTAVEASRLAEYEELFGPDVLQVAGDVSEGMVPVALNPETWVRSWSGGSAVQQDFIRAAAAGTDALTVSRPALAALRALGTSIIDRSGFLRFFRSPKVIAYIVVLLYSALRALPVTFVSQFHGKLWVLWTIDLVTAIPYTWGIIAMVAGRRRRTRIAGALVAIITFVAPYVYFWMKGKSYPFYVIVIVAALIIGTCLLELSRWMRDRIVAWRLGRAEPGPYRPHRLNRMLRTGKNLKAARNLRPHHQPEIHPPGAHCSRQDGQPGTAE